MSAGEDTITPPEQDSFEALLDSACSRLWDRKIRYSLRRIQDLAGVLDRLDRELEELQRCGKAPDCGEAGRGSRLAFKPPAGVPSAETARAGSEAP